MNTQPTVFVLSSSIIYDKTLHCRDIKLIHFGIKRYAKTVLIILVLKLYLSNQINLNFFYRQIFFPLYKLEAFLANSGHSKNCRFSSHKSCSLGWVVTLTRLGRKGVKQCMYVCIVIILVEKSAGVLIVQCSIIMTLECLVSNPLTH